MGLLADLFGMAKKALGIDHEKDLDELKDTTAKQGVGLAGVQAQLANQEKILTNVLREIDRLKGNVAGLQADVRFLKEWKEATEEGIRVLADIKALQEDQIRKFNRLKKRLENDFIPKLLDLSQVAPDEDCREEILNFKKKLRNNLTWAGKKFG
jgi:hypothetical protein